MFSPSVDDEQIFARVATLDVGKAEVVCCARLPAKGRGKRRLQEVSTHSTMTSSLTALAEHLVDSGVERAVMEATSDYWRPAFYLFEAHGLHPWQDVKHLPGRPKTDVLDAVWLCKVAERNLLRPSFVPPIEIRQLRDLTRYRTDLVTAHTAEKNRVEKLLEDACIKLSVVATDIFGVSGRAMMSALIACERDPKVLADMARAAQRKKLPSLEEAFTGRFDAHHAFLLGRMLARVDAITADIAALDLQIETQMAPFADIVHRLDEIAGIAQVAAAAIIAEIGVDMSRFSTPAHPSSWAKFTPRIAASAGKTKGSGSCGHGNRYLARALGGLAVNAGRTPTFLGARYRCIARRRGSRRAVVAVGRSILVIISHLIQNPDTPYRDLGYDHYDRHRDTEAARRQHVRQLESLGYTVTLHPAA